MKAKLIAGISSLMAFLLLMPSLSAQNSRLQGIRNALNELVVKEGPQNLIQTIEEQKAPKFFIEGGDLYELKSKKVTIKDKETTDLFCSDATDLYPGCLVYANSNLGNGNAVPTNDFGVGKVVISLDIDTGGKNSITCNNDRQSVVNAIRELVRQAYTSGYSQPSRAGYLKENYTSSAKMAIDLGCNISYAGAKLKVDTSTESTSSKITHFEDLSMTYYTVHADPVDNDITSLFGPNVTGDQIKQNCQKNGPVTYVSSMNYGVRVYLFEDYEATSFKFNGSEEASYAGSSLSSKQDIVRNSETTGKRVFVNGGPSSLGTGLIENESTVEKVIKKVKEGKGLELSANNQGLPLGCKTRYVASGNLCKRVTNGSYNEISYIKHPKNVHVRVDMETDGDAGSRCKPKFIYQTLKINKKKGTISQRGIEHEAEEKEFSCGASKLKATWNREIILDKNEYIDGNIWFGVRTRAHAGSKWKQAIEGFVDPVSCGGNVHIYVRGDLRSRTYVGSNTPVGLINQTSGKH